MGERLASSTLPRTRDLGGGGGAAYKGNSRAATNSTTTGAMAGIPSRGVRRCEQSRQRGGLRLENKASPSIHARIALQIRPGQPQQFGWTGVTTCNSVSRRKYTRICGEYKPEAAEPWGPARGSTSEIWLAGAKRWGRQRQWSGRSSRSGRSSPETSWRARQRRSRMPACQPSLPADRAGWRAHPGNSQASGL